MKIKLVKRRDATEKGAMLVMIEHEGVKKTFSCKTGETLEVPDDVGYIILGDKRFQGLFSQVTEKSMPKTYQNKALETEAVKTV